MITILTGFCHGGARGQGNYLAGQEAGWPEIFGGWTALCTLDMMMCSEALRWSGKKAGPYIGPYVTLPLAAQREEGHQKERRPEGEGGEGERAEPRKCLCAAAPMAAIPLVILLSPAFVLHGPLAHAPHRACAHRVPALLMLADFYGTLGVEPSSAEFGACWCSFRVVRRSAQSTPASLT